MEPVISSKKIYLYYQLNLAQCSYSTSKLIVSIRISLRPLGKRYEFMTLTPTPYLYQGSVCHIHLETSIVIKTGDTTLSVPGGQQNGCEIPKERLLRPTSPAKDDEKISMHRYPASEQA